MNIETKELKNSEIELEIELTAKELKDYMSQAEKKLGADLEIKGFRKGKIPSNVLRKTIGEEKLRQEALALAVEDSFAKAIAEKGLELIEPAKGIDVKENSEEKFVYTATVKVLPKFVLPEYRGIEVEKKKISVEPKEIDETIDYILKTRTVYTASKEPAQKNNKVEIDFEIKADGKTIDNGVSKNHPVVLGKNVFVPGFEDNILGMRIGEEKNFEINVPSDYYQKSIAGKKIQCTVKVNKIEIPSVPELTDDFAKSLGSFKNVDELKKSIGDGIRMEKEQKEKQRTRLIILEKVAQKTSMEIPEVLVEKQLNNLVQEFEASLQQKGLDLNMYLVHFKKTQDDLRKEWKLQAVKQVKNSLILREIAKKENLVVEEEELNDTVNLFLQRLPDPEELKDINIDVLKRNIYEDLLKEKTLQVLETHAEFL